MGSPARTPRAPKAAPRPPTRLSRATLDKLNASALDEEDAALLRYEEVTPEACKALRLPAAAAGFLLPYFDLSGAPTSFFRVRYMEDTRHGFARATAQKPLRYGQPVGTVNELYLPPYVDWSTLAGDAEVPLVITEGELKAACATKFGVPTIGLGGVWCFQNAKHGKPLLDGFAEFAWAARTVYICFDSDAVTNPDVVAAEARLATRLTEQGAAVRVCRIAAKCEDEVDKMGLDDYIVLHGAERFRAEVLATAFEFSTSEALHALNAKIVYVRDPGLVWDRGTRQRMTPQAFKDHAYANVHYWEARQTKAGTSLVRVPAAKSWIEWEHRSECRGLIFAPNEPDITRAGLLNTWTSWGVPEPVRGYTAPWDHLLGHLFAGDPAARRWFEQWCAYPVQHPGAKLATAVLLWGLTHGSGKTLVGHTLMRLYGEKHSSEIHDADLDDARNEWASDKQFVLADDIVAKGDRALMRRIMTLVTQKTVRLNPKYVPSYAIPDTINYMFTSNEPDALYMDDGDRRFFVHEVHAGKYLDYRKYCDWRESAAGIAALWHHLLNVDLSGFDPQAPAPVSTGKLEMQELGKSDLGSWVRALKDNPDAMLNKFNFRSDFASAPELHAMYDPAGTKRTTVNALARELKRAGFKPPSTGSNLHGKDGVQSKVYVMRNWAKWQKAKWSEACEHFTATRQKGGGKF